ncbi:hypothetical protein HYH03_006566 [Edaphochlamys debaryana]|uniref:RING-type domain-containing protein n=1 Tax=Edaphochlamys debaryana TaxID=47281 RepID=A0A836C199_9CHLO|nr:hypothetical protein HYH03_006566 [Edaphochlamys debaryana]|eukprot:KAG2495294.1 hypothetical protein HYH03_006566 [Edaphochlamys debaryana]
MLIGQPAAQPVHLSVPVAVSSEVQHGAALGPAGQLVDEPGRINARPRNAQGPNPGGRGRGGGGRGGGRGGLSAAVGGRGGGGGGGGGGGQQPPARQTSGEPGAAAPAENGAGGFSRSGAAGGAGGGGAGAAGGGRGGMANANHLLNFQYESARGRGGGGRGGSRGGGGGGSASSARRNPYAQKPQKYDKNKFLQANFRFLVSDAVDVSGYEADADKMFDWDDVLQVEMSSAVPIQCPISLDSPPLCPQITPCGHVFSFPAIMHHLINHGGEQLRRSAPCPLCFAPIVARELRLVRVRPLAVPRVGQRVTLALIRRNRASILPQAVDPAAAAAAAAGTGGAGGGRGGEKGEARKSSGGGGGGGGSGGGGGGGESGFDANPFAKFVVAGDAGELWRAAAAQLAGCAMQLVAEGGSDAAAEAPYVYGALDQLAARARRWAEHRGELLEGRGLLAAKEGTAAAPEALGAAAEAAVKKMFTAAVSDATAAQEAAVKEAAAEAQFPSLAPKPAAAGVAKSPGGGGGGVGGSAWAGAGGASGPAAAAAAAPASPPPGGAAAGAGAGLAGGGGRPAGSIAASVPPPSAPAAPAAAAADPDPAAEAAVTATTQPSGERPFFESVFGDYEGEEGADGAADDSGSRYGRRTSGADEASGADGGSFAAGLLTLGSDAAAGPDLASSLGSAGGGGGLAGGGGAAASESLMGTSPTANTPLNTPGSQGEFYTYQAVDGSWVFLHPLNLRCLLHHYGSYDSCPPVITARLLELEDVVQGDATRRRWRFLSHLPLAGAFKLAEVAVSELLPAASLTPFTEELGAREKRRRRQQASERREAAAAAAAAARAAAARIGPSVEELQAMPTLGRAATAPGGGGGAGGSALMEAASAAAAALAREMQLSPSEVAESIALQASLEEAAAAAAAAGGAPPGGGGGVSFARITKLGFAATGPALGTSPPPVSVAAAAMPGGTWGTRAASGPAPGPAAAAAPSPGGAWGSGKGGAALKAATASAAAASPAGPAGAKPGGFAAALAGGDGDGAGGGSKKPKSGKGMLLFSTGNVRKY